MFDTIYGFLFARRPEHTCKNTHAYQIDECWQLYGSVCVWGKAQFEYIVFAVAQLRWRFTAWRYIL